MKFILVVLSVVVILVRDTQQQCAGENEEILRTLDRISNQVQENQGMLNILVDYLQTRTTIAPPTTTATPTTHFCHSPCFESGGECYCPTTTTTTPTPPPTHFCHPPCVEIEGQCLCTPTPTITTTTTAPPTHFCHPPCVEIEGQCFCTPTPFPPTTVFCPLPCVVAGGLCACPAENRAKNRLT